MSPRRKIQEEDPDSEDYRKKRDRNNEAVKKSRFKSKQKTMETMSRINKLKNENEELEEKVRSMSSKLKLLKELFLDYSTNAKPGSKFKDVDLEKLLADDPVENTKNTPPSRKSR